MNDTDIKLPEPRSGGRYTGPDGRLLINDETLRLLRAAQDTLSMPGLIFDGNTMTFRCTADDTLWSLRYHVPEGAFKQLSDLFLQMAADVREGCFDPNAYLRQLPLVPTKKPNE